LLEPVRRPRVPLGKSRDADAEAARIARARAALDEADELVGVAERVAATVVVGHALRWIAAERENVLNARLAVPIEDRRELVFRMTDAGQVRDRRERRLAL